MRTLRATLVRLWGLFHRQSETDIQNEIESNVQLQVDEHVRAGLTPDAARREAVLKLGGVRATQEACGDRLSLPALRVTFQDLSYATRTLRKSPEFTAAVILVLALGIGANTAIFSVVNAILLRPLAVPNASRLVRFAETYQGLPTWTVGLRTFNDWRQQATAFDDVSAHWLEFVNLTNSSYPEQIPVARVTKDFFHLFGASLAKGRTFSAEEDRPGASPVVVLSHELWRRQFNADPTIIGRAVTLGGEVRLVIGVLDIAFNTEQFDQRPDAWVPFQIDPSARERGQLCIVTGRIKPGVTIQAARADVERFAQNYPWSPEAKSAMESFTVVPLQEAMVADVRTQLLIFVGAVVLVLLIACANVASLLLLRSMDRHHEIAIRMAIGAGRGRIVRQLLTESLTLAFVGGACGLILGWIAIRALLTAYPGNNDPLIVFNQLASLPRIGSSTSEVNIDWRILSFTIALSTLTAVICGLMPALQASHPDVHSVLKQSAGAPTVSFGGSRLRALLVTSQIALAIMLLVGSGLLIRTSFALLTVDRGFDGQNLLTMRMSINGTRFGTAAGIEQLTRDGIDRLQAIPGVTVASTACCVPLETVWQLPFIVAGRPLTARWHGFAGWTFVSPGYFEAFKIPLRRGRLFTDRDKGGASPVVIINEAMARRFWPTGDPLDGQLLLGRGMQQGFEVDPARQIIGIVGDVRDQALNRIPRPAMYVPAVQLPDGVAAFFMQQLPLTWIVRGRVDPRPLSGRIERELETASHGLPITRIRSMDEVAGRSIARTRLSTLLMTAFACAALSLAATGIYALLAFSVKQRTREIGIRLALGAGARDIRFMVLRQGATLVVFGMIIGVASAFGLARLMANLLFGVATHDRVVFMAVPIVLGLVAFVAAWLPARRAAHVQPIVALRYE